MKTYTAGFREAGSLIAGALIGVSMVIIVFAMMASETSHLQIILVFGSPAVLALGFVLQMIVTPRRPGRIPTTMCDVPF